MAFHRRRLPHWTPDGRDLFITWRLHGSLPSHREFPPEDLTSGRAFVWMDRLLDTVRSGPTWLRQERLARMMVESPHYAAQTLGYYHLHAYVVMPNHVHLLLFPQVDPSKLTQSVKGFTAREANKLLHHTGEPFWQRESFDHWVRDRQEFERIRAYIENNPVKAGLVSRPDDYLWSSAAARR